MLCGGMVLQLKGSDVDISTQVPLRSPAAPALWRVWGSGGQFSELALVWLEFSCVGTPEFIWCGYTSIVTPIQELSGVCSPML